MQQSKNSNLTLEQQIDEKKTQAKAEAMKTAKKNYTNREQEAKALKIQQEAKTLVPGKCMPEDIQKLKTRDKVAIVGFAPSWLETPWDDETMDIWGINELYLQIEAKYKKMKRVTGWFEIHDVENSPSRQIKSHHDWLKNAKIPIFMQRKYDWIPNSVPVPKDLIEQFVNQGMLINDVGASFTDYSNQISIMTVVALMMGYKEIHIYGVDMAANSEYQFQKSSVQFFVGLSLGYGVKFLIPKSSELCKFPRFYGFATDAHQPRNLKKTRIKTIKNLANQISQQMLLEQFERERQIKTFEKDMDKLDEGLQQIDDNLMRLSLILEKNKVLLNFLDTMPKDLQQIESKKDSMYLNINTETAQSEKALKDLEIQKQDFLKKQQELERINYINETSFKQSKESLKATLYSYQGIIGECKHDLNNNLV